MLSVRGAREAESASQKVAPHGSRSRPTLAPRHVMPNAPRGLQSPATAVNRDLSHADAPSLLVENRGAGARVTASYRAASSPGEGHLQLQRDQWVL